MKDSNNTVNFLLTIDTEEEGNWGGNFFRADKCTVENINYILPFQQLCDKYGMRPTYLIDYPVATTDFSVKILKKYLDRGRCEIATHLHPWCNPPYEEDINNRNSFSNNLPEELQIKKLQVLTKTIENNFEIKPISYRAGRYGFDNTSISILEKLGYKVDSSVVPFRNVKRVDEPSFGKVQLQPYYLDYSNILRKGDSSILEIPITVEFTKRIPEFLKSIYPDLPDIGIRRILREVFDIDLVWLRPSYASLNQMIKLANSVAASKGTILNMMFHSNELMPNGSPYNKTREDVNQFLLKIEKLVQYLSQNYKLDFRTLSEIYPLFKKQ